MKVSIGSRLFLAIMLAVATVAAIGVQLVRWKLADNFAPHRSGDATDVPGELIDALSAQYRQHRSWSFLPADAAARDAWLRALVLRTPAAPGTQADNRPHAATMGYRVGLLDRHRHLLAGAIANPAIVAVASIDTVQRPLLVDGATVGYLRVATPQNPDDELAVAFLIQQQRNLLIIASIGVLLSALAAALLAAHFRKPIRRLVEGARLLGNGRLDTRLGTQRSDELGELADTFDRLAARLQDAERSRRQWIADTSHELRTPLSVLRGQIEALQDGVRTATPENIALMRRQVLSLTRLVDDLYELARADVGQRAYEKSPTDVWRLLLDVLDGFAEKLRAAGLVATVGAAPARSTIACDADRMRQVASNLLENCMRYTAAGGRIALSATVAGQELRIAIDDSAPGLDEASIDRLGERFFRAEPSRSRQLGGAGLGLALSRQMVEAHAGSLTFAPSPLGGLRATIVLPLESR